MKKRIMSSVLASLLVASTVFGSAAKAESFSNVKKTVTMSTNPTGKDYAIPDVTGSWLYNSQTKTLSWELEWKRKTVGISVS